MSSQGTIKMSVALLFALCFSRSSTIGAVSVVSRAISSHGQFQHVASGSKINGKQSLRSRASSKSSSGIINGTAVDNASKKYSFFAMPTSGPNSNEWLGCGASIISPTWGMMAQHCFGGGDAPCSGPSKLALWLGDVHLSAMGELSAQNIGRHARIEAHVTCHPHFDGKCSHGNDIVLLKLQSALPSWVHPVKINLNGAGTDSVGEVTVNIGYGLRESASDVEVISDVAPPTMREANLTIFADDYAACANVYAGGYGCSDSASEAAAANKSQQLCAGATDYPERDTCSGDSGSPMLDSKGVQVGIVSYGGGPGNKMSGPGRICADPDYMGVYTRVSAFKDFIEEHVTDLP